MTDSNESSAAETSLKLPESPKPKQAPVKPKQAPALPPEIGGQKGPEPTRYGDWEKNGRCTDF